MTLTPEGGAALPVSVTTTRKVQGGSAIPVYGYMTAPTDGRPAMGGSAIPVRVLTAADLKENGGMWTLEGRPYAMPVYTAPAGAVVQGGPALAVYPVNAWPTVPVVPPVVPWYLSGGISASACVAAYQPKGAASLAASYVNLANPGTYDAAPGVAPTFNAATGWTGDGATQYLRLVNLIPTATWTVLARYSGLNANSTLFGSQVTIIVNHFFSFEVWDGTYYYSNDPNGAGTLPTASGVMAMAGKSAYFNATPDITIGAGATVPNFEQYVLCRNMTGAPFYFSTASIQAIAYYNVTLTAPQVAALTTVMAAL